MWQPTRLMRAFIDTYIETVSRGKRPVLQDIAEANGIEKTRPSKWNRDPRFRDALAQILRERQPAIVEAMHVAQMHVAIGGSLEHYRTQLRRLGIETPWDAPPSSDPAAGPMLPHGVTTHTTNGVIVHVHGIPERRPLSELPPPLTLPATPAVPPQPTK